MTANAFNTFIITIIILSKLISHTYNSKKCSFFEVLLESDQLWNCIWRSPYKATAGLKEKKAII